MYMSKKTQLYKVYEIEEELQLIVNLKDMDFEDIFFSHVAVPLQDAWALHKLGETDDAMSEVQECIATDWATAGFDWLMRRAK